MGVELMQPTTVIEQNMIERAISNAINSAIVYPFQNWCLQLWNDFVDLSLPICVTLSLVSLMLTFVGVKKTRTWVLIPIIIYVFIQSTNYIVGGG